jgi:hypothetical protein
MYGVPNGLPNGPYFALSGLNGFDGLGSQG